MMSLTLTHDETFVPVNQRLLRLKNMGAYIIPTLSLESSLLPVKLLLLISPFFNRGCHREHYHRLPGMSVELLVLLLPVPGMWDTLRLCF